VTHAIRFGEKGERSESFSPKRLRAKWGDLNAYS